MVLAPTSSSNWETATPPGGSPGRASRSTFLQTAATVGARQQRCAGHDECGQDGCKQQHMFADNMCTYTCTLAMAVADSIAHGVQGLARRPRAALLPSADRGVN